jgi:hypothetical protein
VRGVHAGFENLHLDHPASDGPPRLGADIRWRREADVTWTRFEDSENWVAFHHPSGDIHLVAPAIHDLWTRLGDQPDSSARSLSAAIGKAAGGAEAADTLIANVLETLNFMADAGLVRPLPL